jgi:chromosome segregation ATPase
MVMGALLVGLQPAWAQSQEGGTGIYTCVDRAGRRITSDRPIPECLDREQRELSSSGITRRIIPPSLNAEERARAEAVARQEAELQTKRAEEQRRDRALLSRYNSAQQHDQERHKQLQALETSETSIQGRIDELKKQQQGLAIEMEFYASAPSKAPAWLTHRIKGNTEQLASQKRLLAGVAEDRQRINDRFDEERARLQQLWPPTPGTR